MDVNPDDMARLCRAMSAVVRERATTEIQEIDGEEVTHVWYRSPHGARYDELLGTVSYDWMSGDGCWEAEAPRDYLGAYETHEDAVREVVWFADAMTTSWDRHVLVGDQLILTWMSAPDVQDAVRRAFPDRDLPVREVTPQEAHRLLARAGRL